MPPKLIFDDDLLREVVASSTSFHMVASKLRPGRALSIFAAARRRIRELDLDTTHFTGVKAPLRSWTDDQLRDAVADSINVAQVIRKLGLVPAGGNYDQVQRRMRELDVDRSHFNRNAQAWSKGLTYVRKPIASSLVVGTRIRSSHTLKLRLFREGLKEAKCELCGWAERAPDGRIPVELDHINGDRFDNRLENLRILCPNCHSLQPTHRGLNKATMRNRRNESVRNPDNL